MNMFVKTILFIGCFLSNCILHSATVSWDGGGDGTTWSDPTNWTGNALPATGDHAVIGLAGTYTVRLTADISVAGLTIGGNSSTATLDAGKFRITLGADSSFIQSGSTLIIGAVPDPTAFVLMLGGSLSVEGVVEWQSGEIFANTYYQPPAGKVITIQKSGTLRWTGNAYRTLSATLNNLGTILWTSGSQRYSQGYSHTNSGTLDINNDTLVVFERIGVNSQGPWVFTNTGIVRKRGQGKAQFKVELQTINGIVDVQEDTLLLNYSTRWENAQVVVAAGTTLQLTANRTNEPHTVAGTLSGNPQGNFIVVGPVNDGYFSNMSSDTTMTGVLQIGGTGIQFNNAILGGVYDPPRKTYRPAPENRGLLRIVGSWQTYISGRFINHDTVRWEGGNLYYSREAELFENRSIFDIAVQDTVIFQTVGVNGSRPGPFVSTGRVLKTGAGKVTSNVDFHVIGGSVDIRRGHLLQEWDSRLEDATVAVNAGATFQLAGYLKDNVIAGTVSGNPQGAFLVSGVQYSYLTNLISDTLKPGRLLIGGIGIQIADAQLGNTLGGVAPVNAGLLRFVQGQPKYIVSDFRNEGNVRWEAGNVYYFTNKTFTNTGLFELLCNGGTFSTYGNGVPTVLVNETSGIVRKSDTTQNTAGLSITNNGKFCVREGRLNLESIIGNRLDFRPSGILSGGGVLNLRNIDTARLSNTGITAPGFADDGSDVGMLVVVGALPHKRFFFDIAGKDSALYDRLRLFSGSYPMKEELSPDTAFVTLLGGFTPVKGNFFDVIEGSVANKLKAVITTPPVVRLFDTYPPNLVRLVLDQPTDSVVRIIAPVVSARQGQDIDIPITVIVPQSLRAAGVQRVEANLRFNVTLLAPVESTPAGTFTSTERTIPLVIPVSQAADTTLINFRFRAALGNDSTTVLALDGGVSLPVPALVVEQDGLFRLLDLCMEGGARLLNPDAKVALTNLVFRQDETLSFDLTSIETGSTEISLVNVYGDKTAVIFTGKLKQGVHSFRYPVYLLARGMYFLVVKTPTVQITEKAVILR